MMNAFVRSNPLILLNKNNNKLFPQVPAPNKSIFQNQKNRIR
jgi:hypothetical protein